MSVHFHQKRNVIGSLTILVLLVLGFFAVNAHIHSVERSVALVQQPSTSQDPVSAQRTRRIADFQSELITVTANGFEPQELIRPQGRFLLVVQNRSGLEVVSLRLNRSARESVSERYLPREQPDWAEVLDLQPGNYQLIESNHPGWVCTLTIMR